MYNSNNIFGNSNHRSEIRKRTWTIMAIFIVLLCSLIWKITNHMYFKAEPLKAMFNAQYTIDEKYGMRYKLLDRNGNILLDYEMKYTAVIDPVDYFRFNEYTSKYDMEALTITLRNYNKNYDLDKIKENGSFEKVRYKIDKVTFEKLKDIKGVKGFYTYEANELVNDRYWKIENVLTNPKYNKKDVEYPVFKDADSLEMQIYNKTKSNEYEKIRFIKGVNGDIAEGRIIYPQNNINVRLTIDKQIQDTVENILHEEKYKYYQQIGVVLMENSTGKIRAMAQKDDTFSNANLGYPTTYGALAGSIFKVIVDEVGLDKNLIDNEKKYSIKNLYKDGHEQLFNYTIAEALAYSSNDIFSQFGRSVGFGNMYDYAEKQGMLDKILNLHDEQSGTFEGDKTEYGDIGQTAIGQMVRMTPLQALSIPSTIINNGIYIQPSIIDAYVNDNDEIVEDNTSKTTSVLKRGTAEKVKLHMMDVVNKGTGNKAFIRGMDIGGKTGTSTYRDVDEKCSDGWFTGFFTSKGINYSMVVFVNKIFVNQGEDKNPIKEDEEGGDTAAPIFKRIAEAINETKK